MRSSKEAGVQTVAELKVRLKTANVGPNVMGRTPIWDRSISKHLQFSRRGKIESIDYMLSSSALHSLSCRL